jgi:hypothetical protein
MTAARCLSHLALIVCGAALATAGCSREPTTPEAKRQRGNEIVRAMSDRLAQATTFTIDATDTRERTRGGQKVAVRTMRSFTVRRPDRIAVRVTGDGDLSGWYDGQKLTFVSDSQKVWARVSAEPTIDATLDRLAERLAMPMPVADFLYSSPYDALIGSASTGGYVGRETVDGVATLHVAYQHPSVDWDLWVNEQGDPLPKKYRVTDKTLTPPRTVEVVFNKWQLGAAVADAAFAPVVPDGYERIPLAVQADEPAAPTPSTP